MNKPLIKNFIFDFFLYFAMFVFLYMNTVLYNSVDMDYWARLLQGNAFWQVGSILKTDIFSYTDTHLWLDHEWGSSVLFSLIQKNGYATVLLFKTLIVFLTFVFIFKTVKIVNLKTNPLFNLVYFIFAVSAMPTITQSWLRCHFFTFLFFAFSVFLLEKIRKNKNYKLLVIFPFLMLLWSNMHGGCVALLGLLGIYTIGEYLNKNTFKYYIYTLIASIAVMFINPYGFEYVKFIFMASTMTRPFVTEWISPFCHPVWNFLWEFKLMYIINLLLLIFSLKNIKKDYTKYILLVVCAYFSCRYVKNTPFFVIVSMIFLYDTLLQNIELICSKLKIFNIKILTVIICTVLIIFSFYKINKNIISLFCPDLSHQPVKVTGFIKSNKLKGNILAPFDMGSYIAYKLYPDNLIYMDGRYEEVYYKETKNLVDNFYNVSEDWDKILNYKYRSDYIIVPKDAILNDFLIKRNDYHYIYSDDDNCLYAHKDVLKEKYIIPLYKFPFTTWQEAFSTNVKFK